MFLILLMQGRMEAHVQEIFSKIVQQLTHGRQVADVRRFLFELMRSLHQSSTENISEWETVSRRVTNQANTQLHTLTLGKYRLTVTYHYLFDLSSYATILVTVIKDSPRKNVTIRKALFLYDCKMQKILELDNEAV